MSTLKWHPTPKDELITAKRLAGDQWHLCQYRDLRKDDIFRAISPEGQAINPLTLQDDSGVVALVTADPIMNDPLGSDGQWYGYGVQCQVFASLDDLKRKALS